MKKIPNKGDTSSEKVLELVRLVNRHLLEGVPVRTLSFETERSERSIWRLVRLYREHGVEGLARKVRTDKGERRKVSGEMRKVIEGLCLRTPRTSLAWIHRQVQEACRKDNVHPPSYTTVRNIYHALHPHVRVFAHEGEKAYKQAFEIIHRMEAERPNEFWQCDHKQLELYGSDHRGRVGRVWLTAIIDDYSRAIPGYYLGIEAPSSMRVALALRQGIWYKNPNWVACGIPEHFYSDLGPDFTSRHVEQVAGDLKFQLHNSEANEPQGRGKIERFFLTVMSMFCPGIVSLQAKPLQIEEIDNAFRNWLLEEYSTRVHSETQQSPTDRFKQGQFIPRMPDSLEQLDLMLHHVGRNRKVQRDGIRFETFRYFDFALGGYVGDEVSIRYDPRDMSEIYVYSDGKYLCRAVCAELAGRQVTIQEIIKNRRARKRELRFSLTDKLTAADEWMARMNPPKELPSPPPDPPPKPPRRIKKYIHE